MNLEGGPKCDTRVALGEDLQHILISSLLHHCQRFWIVNDASRFDGKAAKTAQQSTCFSSHIIGWMLLVIDIHSPE